MLDISLIEKFKSGDLEALQAIYNKYGGSVYDIILSEVPVIQHATELLSHVFVGLAENKDKLQTEQNIKAYLYIKAHALCAEYKKTTPDRNPGSLL